MMPATSDHNDGDGNDYDGASEDIRTKVATTTPFRHENVASDPSTGSERIQGCISALPSPYSTSVEGVGGQLDQNDIPSNRLANQCESPSFQRYYISPEDNSAEVSIIRKMETPKISNV
jgi:hypothetical protein